MIRDRIYLYSCILVISNLVPMVQRYSDWIHLLIRFASDDSNTRQTTPRNAYWKCFQLRIVFDDRLSCHQDQVIFFDDVLLRHYDCDGDGDDDARTLDLWEVVAWLLDYCSSTGQVLAVQTELHPLRFDTDRRLGVDNADSKWSVDLHPVGLMLCCSNCCCLIVIVVYLADQD